MSKAGYIGVDGIARKITGGYIGVDGVARKVKKMYVGDANGKAQLCYKAEPTWTKIANPCGSTSIGYGDGKFVGLGYNYSAYSTDCRTWSEKSMPISGSWSKVVYGNGTFVAVKTGDSANVGIYSTDGVTWNTMTMPSTRYWFDVAYGNGMFVATALGDSNLNGSTIYAYSTNGISWSQGSLPYSDSYFSVYYAGNKFFALNESDTRYYYSTSGTSWSYATTPFNLYSRHIAYGNGVYVISGDSVDSSGANTRINYVAYSTNGISWTQTTFPVEDMWRCITYGFDRFVAVGACGNFVYSTDGATWLQGDFPESTSTYIGYNHIVSGNDMILVASTRYYGYYC